MFFMGIEVAFHEKLQWLVSKTNSVYIYGFARGSLHSVLLTLYQSYVEHDLRKNKIVVPFFTNTLIL
jgi:hypothetical protein